MSRLIALALLSLSACGGDTPQPKAPENHDDDRQAEAKPPPLKVKSELGSLDPSAVKRAFDGLTDRFEKCHEDGLKRIEVLSGSFRFFIRVGEDGGARYAYLLESTLGDRDTERCVLDVVMNARWPKPDGGEGEIKNPPGGGIEFPLNASRPPNAWSQDKIATALDKHGHDANKCKAGASGAFHVTMYVGPGAHGAGKVLGVGAAPPDKDADAKVDCIVKAMMEMKGVPTPGSWPAKVSFDL